MNLSLCLSAKICSGRHRECACECFGYTCNEDDAVIIKCPGNRRDNAERNQQSVLCAKNNLTDLGNVTNALFFAVYMLRTMYLLGHTEEV